MNDTSLVSRGIDVVLSLPRRVKRIVMIGVDAVMIPGVFWLAMTLQTDTFVLLGEFRYLLLVTVACTIGMFSALGLYRSIVRFMSPKAMANITLGVTLAVCAIGVYDRTPGPAKVPLKALAIFWAFALLYAAGSRFFVRYLFLTRRFAPGAKRVVIYGAGEAGATLSSMLFGSSKFEPVAFIDDKRALQGAWINGLKVFPPSQLADLIRYQAVERVLLALPSIPRRRRQEILTSLEPYGVHIQSLPELADIIAGSARIDDLREVDVSDLLGRNTVPPIPSLFDSCVRGKSVMVTGAGGSIGSELCRQILRQGPRRLVLFESSELALYNIERELRELTKAGGIDVEILPLLGNAHHRHRVREVLSACAVQTVYHAAAYKHVPIVEHNVIEGIHNNIISTWYTAEAALETGVDTFVLVSTDKAVNPANVMGATKRFAELVLQAIQSRSTSKRFCMVRFGNVLDSSGSVVPLFRDQIRRGGPITVTHRDVIRYFMTIPEAAQLVIQAGAMAEGGDVFVLDMGHPVRIDDLARRLVHLSGLSVRDDSNPEGDIEIVYSGLRTGEKLFEELLIGTNVTGTEHPRILRAMEHSVPWDRMHAILNDLLLALASFDCRQALHLLVDAVAEYNRSGPIEDYIWTRKTLIEQDAGKIRQLSGKRHVSDTPKAG